MQVYLYKCTGAVCNWWERSPNRNNSNNFYNVNTNGNPNNNNWANNSYGVCLGFYKGFILGPTK